MPQLVDKGIEAHMAGRFDELQRLFRQAILKDPRDCRAIHRFAELARQQHHLPQAIELATQAVELQPSAPQFRLTLAECLRQSGRFEESIEEYGRVLDAWGDHPEVHYALGCSYLRADRVADGIQEFRRCLELNQTFVPAREALAAAVMAQGDLDLAESICRDGLSHDGNSSSDARASGLHAVLGEIAIRKREWQSALRFLNNAIAIRPERAATLAALAEVLNGLKRHTEAAITARKALGLNESSGRARAQLGNALERQGHCVAAAAEYERAINVEPQNPAGHLLLGGLRLRMLGHADALRAFRAAIELAPHSATVHATILMPLNYADGIDEEDVGIEHSSWGLQVSGTGPSRPGYRRSAPHRGGPLRIGYLSQDLHNHPVARFIEPLLAGHHRREYLPIVFSDTHTDDGVTARLRETAAEWHDTRSLANGALAKLISDRDVNILVDLGGHTNSARLLAFVQQPAPVQVAYLGYPNTTGLPRHCMQYRITDSYCDPPASERCFSEALYRLPGPFLCYSPPALPEALPCQRTRRDEAIVFGCFNVMQKITASVVDAWAHILHRVPGSRLFLKNRDLADPALHQLVRDSFAKHDIGPERLILLGPDRTDTQHLLHYRELDIALDTYPYNGTTTTCDALWMGTPVVTWSGCSHRSRVSGSILTTVGLSELIADSPQAYVETAVRLAGAIERWETRRSAIREQFTGSPLMNRADFVERMETAYRDMWHTLS